MNHVHDNEHPIHHLIRDNAIRLPDAPALTQGRATLTYGELNRHADQLAMAIRKTAIAASVVGIWMDRSFEHIIAALAVLKAGSAYAWLEPRDPVQRIRSLIENAGIGLVLVDASHAVEIGEIKAHVAIVNPVVKLEELSAALPQADVFTDSVAYIAFTSGTTGRPKGAMIMHSNLVALVAWHNETFQVTPADRASHLAGLSFDASAWEVWPYLAAGASITLPDDTTRTSPELLTQWLNDERVSIAFVPTALAGRMITAEWPEDCAMRILLTGGETLAIRPKSGLPFEVHNNYGVAECAVVSTSGLITPDASETAARPTIGKPIKGTQVHLLDDDRKPVRRGEEGEMWIGGRSVGKGYLGEPELTAASFIEGSTPGAERLYRTGDRGRLLASGEIMHLGRRDEQRKIRGVRIELGEIETTLRRHQGVADVAVVVEDDMILGSHLVAYVVPSGADKPTGEELHAALARTLPLNYIPSRFATLPSLPLTANGKVDKEVLAVTAAESVAKTLVEPANPIEVNLLAIVKNILAVEDVSADDDFFLLGGHSLLATQVVLRAREAFSIDLSLRDLFAAPTIQTLGEIVAERINARVAAMSEDQIASMLSGFAA